jgi:hypothetical protein
LRRRGRSAAAKASNKAASPDRDGMLREESFTSKCLILSAAVTRFLGRPPAEIGVLSPEVDQALEPVGARNAE